MSTSSMETPTTPPNALQKNYYNTQQQHQQQQQLPHHHTTTTALVFGSDVYRKTFQHPDVYANISYGGASSMAMNEQLQQQQHQINISGTSAHTLLTPSSSTSSSSSAVVGGGASASTAAAIHNHQQLQHLQQQQVAQLAAAAAYSAASLAAASATSAATSYSQSPTYISARPPPPTATTNTTMSGPCHNGSNVKRHADVSVCSSASSCCSSAGGASVGAVGVNAVTPVITQKMSRTIPSDKINLRLILVSGKTKEFLFNPTDSAGDIAQTVFDNWPEDWEREAVSKAEILRLIYQGRFLHCNVTLGALGLPLGKTTVMHLVPRDNLPEPNSQDQRQKSKGGSSRCCSTTCCIL